MGKEFSGSVEAERGNNGNTSNSTSTTSTSDGRRGRGRPPGSTGKPSQENSQLPLVEGQPKIVAVEVPGGSDQQKAKAETGKRGRPSGTKKKSAAKPQGQADYQQLKVLLMTITGIAAGKAQAAELMLTDQEAEQIAKPLANILAKNEGVSAVTSEYADHIALVFACLTIFVPKYFMWRAANPKKTKGGKNNVQSIRTEPAAGNPSTGQHNQGGQTHGSSQQPNRSVTRPAAVSNNGQAFNGSIGDLMPAIAGI